MEFLPVLLNTISGIAAIASIFFAVRAYRIFRQTHQLISKIRSEQSDDRISTAINSDSVSAETIDAILKSSLKKSYGQENIDALIIDKLFSPGSPASISLTKDFFDLVRGTQLPELPGQSNTQYEAEARPRLQVIK